MPDDRPGLDHGLMRPSINGGTASHLVNARLHDVSPNVAAMHRRKRAPAHSIQPARPTAAPPIAKAPMMATLNACAVFFMSAPPCVLARVK